VPHRRHDGRQVCAGQVRGWHAWASVCRRPLSKRIPATLLPPGRLTAGSTAPPPLGPRGARCLHCGGLEGGGEACRAGPPLGCPAAAVPGRRRRLPAGGAWATTAPLTPTAPSPL
jgi:hypothetical protein